MGIDQLALRSVQLGYLKILQMGNTDPNNTKAGKEIRGQASHLISTSQISHQALQPHGLSKTDLSGFDNTAETPWKLKSVQGINYKNNAQFNKRCLPRSLQQQRNYRLHGTKTQQLRTSSPTAIQSLKCVAIERAKQGEFSATKNISRYSPIALTALMSAYTANQIPSSSETSEIAKRRCIASSAKLNYQISLSLADLSLHQTPPKRQLFTKISRPLTQTPRNSDLTQNDGVSSLKSKGSDFFLKFHQFDSNSGTDFTR
ncbi:hypothetical protein F511_39502 [Dorcoceras hygrometricum]|uniref:Uncharacterized protein n=1 Tax=Dorcoceras hygrometricum TaxID=472368 RepID=A0A2Z7C9Q0_9LAMI|nr:hypothetical protein F511_39502 [Dorcoceras hygrometricum]